MVVNDFEIKIVCANNISHDDGSFPVYGDIYEQYEECKREHPNDEIIFGYYVEDISINNFTETPDWFYTIEEAIEWIEGIDKNGY